MSELEDKLNSILGDPQAMGQIMALARSLGGKEGGQPAPPPPSAPPGAAPPADSPFPEEPGPAAPDLSALLGENGLDPRLLSLAGRVMGACQADDDGRAALLQALRPFVRERRWAKLDRAIQIARLSRVIRVALEVFREGGDSHV